MLGFSPNFWQIIYILCDSRVYLGRRGWVHMTPRCVHAMLLQWCLIPCRSMDCSPPGFTVYGILQARIMEWVAMPSSRGSSQPRDWTHVSYVSCTGRQVLTTSATWEAPQHMSNRIHSLEWMWVYCEVCQLLSRVWIFVTPWTEAHQAPLSWDSPGMNTGMGCHALLQRISPIQGLNPGLPHCR